jgi:glycosyltransferase involved in cell wall biosynthesis
MVADEVSGPRPAHRKVLWLSGTCPHPVDGGLASYSAGLSEALVRAGAEVHGLGLRPEGRTDRENGTSVSWSLIEGHRRGQAASAVSRLPNIAHSYALPAFRSALEAVLDKGRWDAVVIDHLQSGWAFDLLRKRRGPGSVASIVHVSHNHEESARNEIASTLSPLTVEGVALRLDARKIARLERRLSHGADLLSVITDEDGMQFARTGSTAAQVVVEPGFDGQRVGQRTIGETVARRVVIVGNFDWHVKRRNLDRFLVEADPRFERAGIELLVVGKAPEDYVAGWATRLRATRFTGFVPDLGAILADARVGVVCEPSGGGFKLKSLDYVFRRLPMAVLAGSVAGLPLEPGESYLSFSDEAALAEGVVAVMDDLPALDRLQDNAYGASDARFSWDERGERLFAAIDRVAPKSRLPRQARPGSPANPPMMTQDVGADGAPGRARRT